MPIVLLFYQFNSSFSYFCISQLQLPTYFYGEVLAINSVLVIIFEIPINVITAKYPNKFIISIGGVLIAIGFGVLSFFNSKFGIITSVVLWTFGEILFFPAIISFSTNLATPKKYGTYMGLYNAAYSFAYMLSPIMGMYFLKLLEAKFFWIISFIWGTVFIFIFTRVFNVSIRFKK